MTYYETKLKERQVMLEAIKRWPYRLEVIKNRVNWPMNQKQFCEKHGLSYTDFSRAKNLSVFPHKSTFDKIQDAFATEGV